MLVPFNINRLRNNTAHKAQESLAIGPVQYDLALRMRCAVERQAKMVLTTLQGEAGDVAGATRQLRLVEARERRAGLLLLARKADKTTRLWANPGK